MALVIQNEAGVSIYTPYERPPQNLTLWTAIPRGLQSFVWTTSLDLIGAGDTALMNLNATFPPNFGYVMADANLKLSMVGASADWSSVVIFNMLEFFRGPMAETGSIVGDWVQNMVQSDHLGDSKSLSVTQPWPTFPLVGVPGSTGIKATISAFNNAGTARSAGLIISYLSFWQFDLEQIRKFPINSPIPTHAR